MPYSEAYAKLAEYVGKPDVKPAKFKVLNKLAKKYLVISDTHSPFHNKQKIAEVLDLHQDADEIIIDGDLTDQYSVSRFSKRMDISFKEEMAETMALIDYIAARFPKVTIVEGNHCERVRKHLEKRVEPELMFLCRYNIIELMCNPHSNITVVKDRYEFPDGNGEALVNYFTVLGKDCVIGHFEKSSKMPVKAVLDSYTWLESWSKHFKIGPIRLFLQGHTHRLSKYPIGDGSVVLGETGNLCQVQEYSVSPKAVYTPHLNGYWIVYQTDGVTDLNKSNFFLC